jgi:hypothetical protein
VVVKASIFWDITPCIPLKVTDVSEENVASVFRVEECKMLGLFDAADESSMFLRNVCRLSADYTVLYPRR